MINKLLDMSIYFSFDKSGFKRHEKKFNDKILSFKKSSCALITGGTSGIGRSVVETLYEKGVKTIFTGRSSKKAEVVLDNCKNSTFFPLDLADWKLLDELVNETLHLDYLVLNAGGMPEEGNFNDHGIEIQHASQLFGHYYLLKKLNERNKVSKDTKIVWVSSGGMYLKKFDIEQVQSIDKYDKVQYYANVKRAQVELMDYFIEQTGLKKMYVMHPGWVNTPGVETAIPGFYDFTLKRLRETWQGADTILYLLSDQAKNLKPGGFYFDRELRDKRFFKFTESDVSGLIEQLESHYPKA